MREAEQIADQLWRSLQGPAWHGPALLELLGDVNAAEAASHPVAASHSIWELVGHVTAWSRFVEHRLRGEEYEVSEAANFPAPAEVSEGAWEASRGRLVAATEALRKEILQLDEVQLGERVKPRKWARFRNTFCCTGSCSTICTMPARSLY
ncbi:MAG: DinB family protein [Bryobacterales bacterium]